MGVEGSREAGSPDVRGRTTDSPDRGVAYSVARSTRRTIAPPFRLPVLHRVRLSVPTRGRNHQAAGSVACCSILVDDLLRDPPARGDLETIGFGPGPDGLVVDAAGGSRAGRAPTLAHAADATGARDVDAERVLELPGVLGSKVDFVGGPIQRERDRLSVPVELSPIDVVVDLDNRLLCHGYFPSS